MIPPRPTIPQGDGELVAEPAPDLWPELMRANRAAEAGWAFTVGGVTSHDFRDRIRVELIQSAQTFMRRVGVAFPEPDPSAPILMTGHQPELYHPGVWVKNFLVSAVAERAEATGFNIVVDTDAYESVGIRMPSFGPELSVQTHLLSHSESQQYYALAPVPSVQQIDRFCGEVGASLDSLPGSAAAAHFGDYCSELPGARSDSLNMGEFLTISRRRYEARAATSYLEVPLSALTTLRTFLLFVAHLALDAPRFAEIHNSELRRYRELTGTRSQVQPFPELGVLDGGWVELPFWLQTPQSRTSLSCKQEEGRLLLDAGGVIVESAAEPDAVAEMLAQIEGIVSPKAVTLTMFLRLFACDLFVHGVGGAGYDRLTDSVIAEYFGIEPPSFATASLTMYMPLGEHADPREDIAEVRQKLHRLEHNPDAFISDYTFADDSEREHVARLAKEKTTLVAAIALEGADKKALGAKIREVNGGIGEALAPVREGLLAELDHLEALLADAEIRTDRTYPFFFWGPDEIADKAR